MIPELSAGNACSDVGPAFYNETFTFGPHELSTIQGPENITKEFNFGDLPCPPPDVASDAIWLYNPAVNPTQTYAPVIAPFSQIYDLHPEFKDCTVALNQGFDPPLALPVAEGPSVPKYLPPGRSRGPRLGPLRQRNDPMNAHNVPRGPAQTSI